MQERIVCYWKGQHALYLEKFKQASPPGARITGIDYIFSVYHLGAKGDFAIDGQ